MTAQDKMIGGVFRLGACLGQSKDGAVYETEYGNNAQPAVIKVRRGDAPDSERTLARWRAAMDLAHPHLMRLFAAGRSAQEEVTVIYVVMERAEESLAGVLAERPLSDTETREMLEPTLDALAYLHRNGYAHASLKPSNILAAGDGLRLSSDTLARIEEDGVPAEDVWALGSVIVQALTQQLPEMDEDSGPYILRDVPEPFTEIVRHCLDPDSDKRWTVEQIAQRLNPQPAAPAPLPARAAVRPPSETRIVKSRKPIYAALAALAVLVGILIGVTRKPDRAPVAPPTPPPAAVKKPPALSPAPAPAVRTPEPVKQQAARPHDRRADGWAVVVASYRDRGAAEKRAHELARKWPKFKVDVFKPAADKAHDLVVIGRNLSEDEAEALRKRAVASGFPRDTYIKRLL